MYRSHFLSRCNLTEALLIQHEISNPSAVALHHFLFSTTKNTFTNKFNFNCTTKYKNYQFHLAFMLATTNNYSPSEVIQIHI